jgi:hypothetical protein
MNANDLIQALTCLPALAPVIAGLFLVWLRS